MKNNSDNITVVPFLVVPGRVLYYLERPNSLNVVESQQTETALDAAFRWLQEQGLKGEGRSAQAFDRTVVAVRVTSLPSKRRHNWYPSVYLQRSGLSRTEKKVMAAMHDRHNERDWGS